jgi:hypothetical protein
MNMATWESMKMAELLYGGILEKDHHWNILAD